MGCNCRKKRLVNKQKIVQTNEKKEQQSDVEKTSSEAKNNKEDKLNMLKTIWEKSKEDK